MWYAYEVCMIADNHPRYDLLTLYISGKLEYSLSEEISLSSGGLGIELSWGLAGLRASKTASSPSGTGGTGGPVLVRVTLEISGGEEGSWETC